MNGARLLLAVVGIVVGLAACDVAPSAVQTAVPVATATQAGLSGDTTGATPDASVEAGATNVPLTFASEPPPACAATDQDRYVYNPARLRTVAACMVVTGEVAAVRTEADGDLHILVALDPAYVHLLTPANQGEELGDLVVEPVCVRGVSQADAIATCAADSDPLASLPTTVGAHVWLEGRYVLDLEHGGWAELHPLYRWGSLATVAAPPTAGPTAHPATTGPVSVRITSLSSPIARGATATIAAVTRADASCSIVVRYKSGPSKAAGLYPKTASGAGDVAWSWRVGTSTTLGSWPITITCSSGSATATASTSITVQ